MKVFNKTSFSPGGNSLPLKKGRKKRNGKTKQDETSLTMHLFYR